MGDTLVSRFRAVDASASAFADETGVRLTHGELARVLAGWRDRLRTHGAGPTDRVGVLCTTGWRSGAALLGVMCAATAALLEPALTDRELRDNLDALRPVLLVTEAAHAERLERLGGGVPVLALDELPDGPPCADDDPAPGDLSLLAFTSGTTARPKIVQLTQGNLVAAADAIAASVALTPADRALNLMPLYHCHGITAGLLAPLLHGGSTVCHRITDSAALTAVARAAGPTWYSSAPVIHNTLLVLLRTDPELRDALRLRVARSTSSALPAEWRTALEQLLGAPLIEAYALTEAPGHVASNPLDGVRKPGTVGRAAGTELALLTEGELHSGPGVTGEIVVRGPNVMPGYAGLPEAEQPFVDGWFRTGDQGRFDEDGYLSITGRVNDIISRGSEKISPIEVETVLLRHPAVAEAAVYGRPHRTLGQEVAAAVVLAAGHRVSEDELCDHAATELAGWKVPVTVDFVDELPRTRNGKLRRTAPTRP